MRRGLCRYGGIRIRGLKVGIESSMGIVFEVRDRWKSWEVSMVGVCIVLFG